MKSLREILAAASVDRLGIGIGIATGEAFVGNVGGGEVAEYTAIGDTVNVAARLQSEAAAGEILISQETYTGVVMEFPYAKRHELLLKGKSEPVIAWEIMQDTPVRRVDDVNKDFTVDRANLNPSPRSYS